MIEINCLKFLNYSFQLSFIIGLTFAHSGGGFFSYFGFGNRDKTSVCSNITSAQSYLTQILPIINSLLANSTYKPILESGWTNYIAFLQNTTNQALLSSNCTVYVANLKAAVVADDNAERIRDDIASIIDKKFEQVARNATGNSGYKELYDNGRKGPRF